MNNYTYPVLLETDSSYKEEYLFRLENESHSFDESNMYIECDCSLNSESIIEMIKNHQAYILLTATTMMNKIVKKVDSLDDKIHFEIPLNILVDSDNIILEAFVLVKNEFTLQYCGEMEDIYKDFRAKKMKTNMQLAISNSVILYYRTVEDTFVALSKSPELENKGLRVEFNNSDSILIKAGNSFCDAYVAMANDNPVAKELMNCFIAFVGLYQTVLAIKENPDILDDIKEYEWYEGLEFLFAKNHTTVSDFFDNNTEGVQELFEGIQEIIGNELENTFIRCRALSKSKRGDENE